MIIQLNDKECTAINVNKLVAVWKGRLESGSKIYIRANYEVSLQLYYKNKRERDRDYDVLVRYWISRD